MLRSDPGPGPGFFNFRSPLCFRVWKIDGNNAAAPLSYIGVDNPTRAFIDKPDGSVNPVSAQNTA